MVKIIMGLKGSGKTKKLVDLVRSAVETANGDVVVIEKDKKLTYDIPYQARLVDAASYPIGTYEFLKGLICGIHAGNYDITDILVDSTLKIGGADLNALTSFLAKIKMLTDSAKVNIKFSISADSADFPEEIFKLAEIK